MPLPPPPAEAFNNTGNSNSLSVQLIITTLFIKTNLSFWPPVPVFQSTGLDRDSQESEG